MSTFQLSVISIFVAFIVIGVGAFAMFGGVFGGGGIGAVTIWGTIPQETGDYLLDSLRSADKSLQDVHYIEKGAGSYESTMLNAMASGAAPDLFLVTQEQLGAFSDKIITIPYGTVSQSQFISSFVDEGQLFLTPQGALALPFMIDPLVMYWNRDLFGSAGIASAPAYWNDFLTLAPKMYSANSSQNITRSAVALGAWSNVAHAKEILSTLFIQAGEPIISRNAQGALIPVFGNTPSNTSGNPAESALRFYTEFGNPSKTTYSWNRSLPRSDEAFIAGSLGVYFGFASEYRTLGERNPNLRFAVAVMPQLQVGSKSTYGKITALAIPRAARNVAGAAAVAQKLTGASAAAALVSYTGMPSARRDVAPDTSANSVSDVFVQSALIARGWVDPGKKETDQVFKTMIESVVSGGQEPSGAVSEAAQEFVRLIPVRF